MTRQRKQSDAELIRQTLAFAHGRLAAEKADYAEAVASYWEAAADICEAEAAFANITELTSDLVVRLGHLTELLLSPKLLAMLENLPAAKARGEEEYANIVSGIRQEARALITEAKIRTGRMGREEAYIVLADGPRAAAEVINTTYPRLLQLWKPTGDRDEAARERYAELEQAYAFLKQHGSA